MLVFTAEQEIILYIETARDKVVFINFQQTQKIIFIITINKSLVS